MFRRSGVLLTALVLGMTLVSAVPATAESSDRAAGRAFPTEFALPNGFQPEGITIGRAPTAYFGSLVDGALYRVDLRTGKGTVFSEGSGTPAVGLKIDRRQRLFIAGGPGTGNVVDARSGKVLASYQFATGADTFVNDVVVTDNAAWFTDSFRPVLYKLTLGRHGSLPSTFTTVPLTGDYSHVAGEFNLNGVETTPDGKSLLVVQSVTGKLFKVNPATGATKLVDLGGTAVSSGDGMLREGNTLYVVLNFSNTVVAYKLNRSGTTGKLFATVTDPRFDIPTTVASFGNRLYLPNARFSTTPTPETTYNAVAIPKP